jgi:hypothetical protein
MTLPNLIGIGAQRAATTWMYHCLKEHPQVFAPEKKEIHFFDENFDKGLDWYESHFKGAGTKRIIIDITPNYLNVEGAMEKMAEIVPEAKLFVILREPVSRAYSSYNLLYEQHFQGKTFRDAFEATDYLKRLSTYAGDLRRAFNLFGRDNVLVFTYDDVVTNPELVLRELYTFAGIDNDFVPESVNVRYNPVLFARLQETLERLRLGGILDRFKQSPFGKALKNRLSTNRKRPGDRDTSVQATDKIADREYLDKLKIEFREDILEVQRLIDRDLSNWL